MGVRNWWRRRRHEQRWRNAEWDQPGPLREFVYLDEVSVYSLVASQFGSVVTEVTQTQASSLQSEMSSGVGLAAPLKADVGSKIQTGETRTSQVLRKALIQTTFKQLRETAEKSGALRRADVQVPTLKSGHNVKELASNQATSAFVFTASQLRRGDLVELDVELDAEPVFQAGMAVSGVLDIVQDDPAAFGINDDAGLSQLRLASRILDKMLVGLVPIRARAVQFEVVDVDGEEWVVHRGLLDQIADRPPTRPLFVVGVAQQALFWKDVRRVLFSGAEFRVLARINRTGVQPTWTPVKLVDVLGRVMPELADMMDTLNRGVLSAISTAVSAQQNTAALARVHAAVKTYAALLADRAGIDLTEADLTSHGLLPAQATTEVGVLELRRILEPVTELVATRSGERVSSEIAADLRAAAITHAGLMDHTAPAVAFEPGPATQERFLDVEIIAAYW